MQLTLSESLFSINTYAALTSTRSPQRLEMKNHGPEQADQLSGKLVNTFLVLMNLLVFL